jgi:hypothetical protein
MTWIVAWSQGTRRPFIQIFSAFVKAIPGPLDAALVAPPQRDFRKVARV